ncbi:retropepsin-like aspartic protease family protein [Pantanalinema sp. GBBB05]|uniref:retropepsin-like aspartic protease family protein n=1 Tax=Pantanalinema sp. GBBB05 TaxID=2604139 RepID=UPI001D1F832D|nr:aspartyl protease [Pantanalinema sp. GBBB05]
MFKPPHSGVALLFLSGMLLSGTIACSQSNSSSTSTTAVQPVVASSPASAVASPSPIAAVPSTTAPAHDPYRMALDKAESAVNISQAAQSKDDWTLVVDRWQKAVDLIQTVPASSPYRAMAKTKLAEYQRNLKYAKQRVAKAGSGAIAFNPGLPNMEVRSVPSAGAGRAFQVPIKRRAGGTPVIDVTFNGSKTYEMIVDTGASATVITDTMASELGVKVIGSAKFSTANGVAEVPLGYVDSINVGGATIKDVVVSINSTLGDVGLLGHDFFGDFDVTVREEVVEFRKR